MKPTKISPTVVERAAAVAWLVWQGGWQQWPPLDLDDAHGWRVAIRAALRAAARDNETVAGAARDRVWLAVLARRGDLRGLSDAGVRRILYKFPPRIVRAFLASRSRAAAEKPKKKARKGRP